MPSVSRPASFRRRRGASQFPAAPSGTRRPLRARPGADGRHNALDVTKESMVGNWRVRMPAVCDMFLTLTNLGSGSRGGTRGCAGELTAMGSWEVAGKQVVLKDRNGNPIARLYKTAEPLQRLDQSRPADQPQPLRPPAVAPPIAA